MAFNRCQVAATSAIGANHALTKSHVPSPGHTSQPHPHALHGLLTRPRAPLSTYALKPAPARAHRSVQHPHACLALLSSRPNATPCSAWDAVAPRMRLCPSPRALAQVRSSSPCSSPYSAHAHVPGISSMAGRPSLRPDTNLSSIPRRRAVPLPCLNWAVWNQGSRACARIRTLAPIPDSNAPSPARTPKLMGHRRGTRTLSRTLRVHRASGP